MKAGDIIQHNQSGETWTVAAVSPDGTYIVCCGLPETIAKVSECTLIESCNSEYHRKFLEVVIAKYGDQLRGSWAKIEQGVEAAKGTKQTYSSDIIKDEDNANKTPKKEILEKDIKDAPSHYDHNEACAWVCGWQAAIRAVKDTI